MPLERIQDGQGGIKVFIFEPKRFGEADEHREVLISYNSKDIVKLPTITEEQISKLPNDLQKEERQEVDFRYILPSGDEVVFIRIYDLDGISSSNSYRVGAHSIKGPYHLINKLL